MGPAGGILKVDKPAGPTSHDIVARVRRALRTKKVGHTGTLDPFASGLMLVCVGPSTRLAEYLTGHPKTYEARLRLGRETETLDPEGAVVAEDDAWTSLTADRVHQVAATFAGEQDQLPPRYSAKKVDGKRAYEAAREGETLELQPVKIMVESFEVLSFEGDSVEFRCRCSAGTYVRVLGRDLAHALGTVGSLTALRRTSIGAFGLDGAISGDALVADVDIPDAAWLDPVAALSDLPRLEADEESVRRLRLGQRVRLDGAEEDHARVVVTAGSRLIAVARTEDGVVRPSKVFPA